MNIKQIFLIVRISKTGTKNYIAEFDYTESTIKTSTLIEEAKQYDSYMIAFEEMKNVINEDFYPEEDIEPQQYFYEIKEVYQGRN